MTAKLLMICSVALFAAPVLARERFDSPEAASKAIIDAAGNQDATRLVAILGPESKGILTSGDASRDSAEQAEFARLARAKHRIEIPSMNPNRAVLSIGDEDWPFPVPMVRANGKWAFDAAETPIEMRARRIGANELDAIEICHDYVEAQQKYASEERDKDGMLAYAARLMSTPGQHDGLYWQGANEPLVPELLAKAEWDGERNGRPQPYHGYYFRVLDRQGPHAPGGTHSYVAKNKLIGGFALIAWPADYEASGIHTFIVNQDGVVYEKDLPPAPGRTLLSFDPDELWEPVE